MEVQMGSGYTRVGIR